MTLPFPWLLLIACALFGAFPRLSMAATNRKPGPEYVRVIDWATEQKLKPVWIKRDESLLLTGGATRIVLNMKSRQATVNGIRVWLLYPVVQTQGWVRISKVDVSHTLGPILRPPKNSSNDRLTTVCLDAGHGGKDPGYRSGSRNEKTYTLLLARELRDQLSKQKIKVVSTRSTDIYVDLDYRPEIARRDGADLLLSLHFNSAGRANEVTGAEVYCLTPAGQPSTGDGGEVSTTASFPGNRNDSKNLYLAYHVQRALVNRLAVDDRGVQRARFAVLRGATMPAILVEAGFMSHPVESRKIYSPEYRKRIAQAIVEGVMAYKRVVDPTPTKSPPPRKPAPVGKSTTSKTSKSSARR